MLDGSKQFASYSFKEKLKNKGSQVGRTKKNLEKKDLSLFSFNYFGN
jgi:hypothetical protein